MKLDDAYNAWGNMSENRELAQKTKKIFHNIWWLIPTNKPCNYYTLEVLGRALVQANGAHSDKVSAASVMCHVLNYAHNVDPEGNNKPSFSFSDIVNYTGEKENEMTEMTGDGSLASDGGMAAEKAAKAAIKREKNDAGIGSSEREQTRRDNGKAVVQLDPDTLKPVKVWPSCFAAQKEMGIKNVQRAIGRHGISGGFYWCRPGDEEGFKPLEKRGRKKGGKYTKAKSTTHRLTPITEEPKPLTKEQKELHRKVFDGPERQPTDEQQEQLKEAEVAVAEARRDFEEQIAEHVDQVLQKCTDDELIAELRRREWHGTVHITRTIEL